MQATWKAFLNLFFPLSTSVAGSSLLIIPFSPIPDSLNAEITPSLELRTKVNQRFVSYLESPADVLIILVNHQELLRVTWRLVVEKNAVKCIKNINIILIILGYIILSCFYNFKCQFCSKMSFFYVNYIKKNYNCILRCKNTYIFHVYYTYNSILKYYILYYIYVLHYYILQSWLASFYTKMPFKRYLKKIYVNGSLRCKNSSIPMSKNRIYVHVNFCSHLCNLKWVCAFVRVQSMCNALDFLYTRR